MALFHAARQPVHSNLFHLRLQGRHPIGADAFTLIELLIVLVIISIVASIATMSALSARVQANEGQAKLALKAIASGAEMYHNTQASYPADLATMGEDYVSSDLVAGQKSGYSFELASNTQGSTYTCTAVPISQYHTGVKSYCINALNAILIYDNAPSLSADGTDCPSGGTPLST